jgi:multidrug efflux pump subunit AcrA (membrane-fusion protein)
LLAIVVIGGGYYHVTTTSRDDDTTQTEPAAAAPTAPTANKPSSLLASGYIAAKTPILLSATVSGRVQEIKVDAGDTITKGQVVALMDEGAARADLALAGARVRDAKRLHQRTLMLVRAQAATPSDLERALGAIEVAGAEYRVKQQKLDELRIRSPINGTVLEVITRPGESVTVGNQAAGILRVADLRALVAEVDVAEAELKNVRLGQAAEVISEARRDKPYKGVVREIAEQADRARGTILVKVDIIAEGPPPADPVKEPPPAPKEPEKKKPDPRKGRRPAKKVPAKTPAPPAPPPAEPVAEPVKDPNQLRPGMAVQVRFIVNPPPASP